MGRFVEQVSFEPEVEKHKGTVKNVTIKTTN